MHNTCQKKVKMSLLPFKSGCSIFITGCTMSGKSTLTYKLLQNINKMFTKPIPQRILYCYGVYQPLFDEMKQTIPNIKFHQDLPELEDVTDNTLIILDDLISKAVKNDAVEGIFTQGCHHRGITIILISQNLYPQGKSAKTIQINTSYLILLQNLRDRSSLQILNRQIFPHYHQFLSKCFEDAMKEKYGYLVIDLHPHSNDKTRVRSHIFPGEYPVVYNPIKSIKEVKTK